MKKLWGKGGSNIGKIVTKTITGEKLSEHEKTTLRDFRAEVVPVNPQLAIQEQETREAEERAVLAEAQAKAAIERSEKLKAELREAQAKLVAEQAEREELQLLAQLEEMRQKVQIEEHKSSSNGSVSKVVSGSVAVDEEMELALALSLSIEEVTPKKEMEELASKLVAKTIDVNAIKLPQAKFSLLEKICMEQYSIELSNDGSKALQEGLDASLNIIESNIIGDI